MKNNNKNHHCHHHEHNHNHSFKIPLIGYALGVLVYILMLFIKNDVIILSLSIISIILAGYHVIFEGFKDTVIESLEKKRFSPNVHLLMTLAAIGAIIIKEYNEATLLILIFSGSHFLEDYAESRSQKEITNLLNISPQTARRVNDDGSIEIISISDVQINDNLKVLIGDQIPTDGVILKGKTDINEAVITGESMPVFKETGEPVYGSTINLSDEIIIKVTKDASQTVIAKIIELVSQTKKNISKTAQLIKKIEPIYVTIVLIFAPIFYLLGRYVINWEAQESFYKTMVYLIVTSPCALAATDIPATLSAISNLAKRGVLFKGGSYLSNLSDMKVVAFDKTGTITEGKPVLVDKFLADPSNATEIKNYQSIIVSMESKSNHPLADAILEHYKDIEAQDIEVENIIGVGLKTVINNDTYVISKPSYIKKVSETVKVKTEKLAKEGKTVIYFSKNYEVLIIFALQDVPKENVNKVMQYFNEQSIKTVMITGDSRLTAESIGSQIGVSEIYANIMPEQKQSIIENLQEKFGVTAMLGDGINDALALTTADIGIAMKDGTDIAIDVADGVLMKNDLEKFVYTHKVSKKLRNVVWQNIIFSLMVIIFLLINNIIGHMDMPIAVLFHEGSTVIVILNGLRLLIPIKK